MATSKLYPTLSKFYEGQYIDIISEIDTACAEKVSEDKLYRKEPHQDRTNKVSTNKLNNLKSNNRKEDNMKSQIPSLYPRLSKNVTNHEKSEEHYSNIPQTLPTAPPVELLDEDFLRFIEDAIQDQNLNSSLDEIPTADYSSRTISDEIIFDNTWVDDMLPDYDITIENAEADFLNNLNKTDPKISQDKLLYDKAKTGH
uniref:Uncharacterized protein n=1 Tax=Arion vulgaris TaxID=1028688 RepID=A0A0B6ZLZ6_9EUPU